MFKMSVSFLVFLNVLSIMDSATHKVYENLQLQIYIYQFLLICLSIFISFISKLYYWVHAIVFYINELIVLSLT